MDLNDSLPPSNVVQEGDTVAMEANDETDIGGDSVANESNGPGVGDAADAATSRPVVEATA